MDEKLCMSTHPFPKHNDCLTVVEIMVGMCNSAKYIILPNI